MEVKTTDEYFIERTFIKMDHPCGQTQDGKERLVQKFGAEMVKRRESFADKHKNHLLTRDVYWHEVNGGKFLLQYLKRKLRYRRRSEV